MSSQERDMPKVSSSDSIGEAERWPNSEAGPLPIAIGWEAAAAVAAAAAAAAAAAPAATRFSTWFSPWDIVSLVARGRGVGGGRGSVPSARDVRSGRGYDGPRRELRMLLRGQGALQLAYDMHGRLFRGALRLQRTNARLQRSDLLLKVGHVGLVPKSGLSRGLRLARELVAACPVERGCVLVIDQG